MELPCQSNENLSFCPAVLSQTNLDHLVEKNDVRAFDNGETPNQDISSHTLSSNLLINSGYRGDVSNLINIACGNDIKLGSAINRISSHFDPFEELGRFHGNRIEKNLNSQISLNHLKLYKSQGIRILKVQLEGDVDFSIDLSKKMVSNEI
jgi:hypothetical protein